jgi:hypothetical protein
MVLLVCFCVLQVILTTATVMATVVATVVATDMDSTATILITGGRDRIAIRSKSSKHVQNKIEI